MRIAIVGTGYIGLVSGTCFAECGNDVACVDVDREKIDQLRRGLIPIHEPGLAELVRRNLDAGRLTFSTDLAGAIAGRRVIFIAVGTPPGTDGSADLGAVWAVVDEIRRQATDSKTVVVKSTCPVGTNARVLARLNSVSGKQGPIRHRAASNPEFLKEGCAVDDFMKPDRVVVGVREEEVAELLRELHAPFLRSGRPMLVMTPESAEMTKYAANCMLATKISFINEMANLCELLGADINDVRMGMGHDVRIGFQFLHPGVGYGGSCFPKDVCAMAARSKEVGNPSLILQAVDQVNEKQKRLLFAKLRQLFDGELAGRTIGVWGLAFKPRTDDVREAPSLVLIRELLDAGAEVRAFDPEALDNARRILGERITYCARAYDAAAGADALAVVTEWQELRNPDFERLKQLMKQPVLVDGRNLYDPGQMARYGFTYASIGRQTTTPGPAPGTLLKSPADDEPADAAALAAGS